MRSSASRAAKLSYKFQRLRESLRAAIESGELSGKLPGERVLAERFNVNAKTLSKALTDLAAEGLLERTIGKGTFVRSGSSDDTATRSAANEPWLIICDGSDEEARFAEALARRNPKTKIVFETSGLRPSFLNQFRYAIDLAPDSPAQFIRGLLVRGMTVVRACAEPKTHSVHAVLLDRALAATRVLRDVLMRGHRRIAIVDPGEQPSIDFTRLATEAAEQLDRTASVQQTTVDDLPAAVRAGATVVLASSPEAAEAVIRTCDEAGLKVPEDVSLVATGVCDTPPCRGYFLRTDQKIDAVIDVLNQPQHIRPTVLWLTGAFHDLPTVATLPDVNGDDPSGDVRSGAA